MNEKDFARVRDLFDDAVGRDAAGRARLLAETAAADPGLARELEALLAADASPEDTLDRGAAALLGDAPAEPPAADLCGARVGPYRVDEHLASGGMAHVYRATHAKDGAERTVAFKVLRPGRSGGALLEAFRRERRTLAALRHEHVVSFLDAGALPDGRPYLVMELVDGEPLTAWARRVPLRERLRVFGEVLAAVQYAHQMLVVHRDLKPSNVLVTPRGSPKLLDFGIASLLAESGAREDHDDAIRFAAGESGGVPGPLTPAYASPEQLRGEAVSAASDVYSLGVLLHEIASGALPGAGTTPRGDLGAVVRKALDPKPERRYGSAERFAEDVRRVLAREPVAARKASWSRRAALFARRRPWQLAFGAAAAVAVVASFVAADARRRFAEQDASRGWGAHAQAKQAAWILEDALATVAAADATQARHAAAQLEQALARELRDDPETETMVRLALARLLLDSGDRDAALVHAERAAELAAVTPGVGPRERERAQELLERAREE